MFKYDIYFKCVIVSWSSATGSHYSMEFSVQNGGGNSHVMGATVAMERSIEFRLLCFYVMKCLADEPSQVTGFWEHGCLWPYSCWTTHTQHEMTLQ